MDKQTKELLIALSCQYHTSDFIANDPVSFPHRYTRKEDIEISGLLIAIMSFGNRKQILKKGDVLHSLLGNSPYDHVLSKKWQIDFPLHDTRSFYRTLNHHTFHLLFQRLYAAYTTHQSLEDMLLTYEGTPMERLCRFLEVSFKSPQKKLNMFLRWMIRRNSVVDFGIWTSFSPADLLIPLDTHVLRVAQKLGLTDSPSPTLRNAIHITRSLQNVFPDDPCLGDFALFGYGVNETKIQRTMPLPVSL